MTMMSDEIVDSIWKNMASRFEIIRSKTIDNKFIWLFVDRSNFEQVSSKWFTMRKDSIEILWFFYRELWFSINQCLCYLSYFLSWYFYADDQ